ncbi:MAG: reverse transcriptase/maturase family protein [Candidatus Woesearchaeota archaeon]
MAVSVMKEPTLQGWLSHTKDPLRNTQPSNPDNAYNLDLDNGQVNNDDKNNDNAVRCVREHIFTFKEVFEGYLVCRKGKRNTINALKFEQNLECNIERLVYELNKRTYKPARSVCFTILRPKPREIFAADFRDRIVHHVLFKYLNPIYEKKFIYDSFACRKNKGTLAATKRLQTQTRKITQNNKQRAYYLQLDIHNFFMSIDKQILFNLIKRNLKDESFFWLAKTCIFHDPTKAYINKTPKEFYGKVPGHKSLPNQEKYVGLPIGNLTSQFFANVYLDALDQFVKHTLKAKYYIRYVDDFVLLHENKEQLNTWKKDIDLFLRKTLHLTLKDLVKIHPISNGINFVGYIIRPNYLLPRNRNVHTLYQTLQRFEKAVVQTNEGYILNTYDAIPSLKCSLQSHIGHLYYAHSKRILFALQKRFSFLSLFFIFDGYTVRNFWEQKYCTFKDQKIFFESLVKQNMLCMQVGIWYRIFGVYAYYIAHLSNKKILSTTYYDYVDVTRNELFSYMPKILQKYSHCVIVKQVSQEGCILRKLHYIANLP